MVRVSGHYGRNLVVGFSEHYVIGLLLKNYLTILITHLC